MGDSVRLMRGGDPDVQPATDVPVTYHFAEVDRRKSLAWLALVLVAVAAIALRWRGVLAISGLDAINGQSVAEPIVATIVGCLALIAAIPVTPGLASMLLSRLPVEALPEAHHHHH